MTITLQDTSMILGVKIRGFPVTGDTDSTSWEDHVVEFLGRPLPNLEPGKKGRSSGVTLKWLQREFQQCTPGADESIVNYFYRA
jgi:hypothetical protein